MNLLLSALLLCSASFAGNLGCSSMHDQQHCEILSIDCATANRALSLDLHHVFSRRARQDSCEISRISISFCYFNRARFSSLAALLARHKTTVQSVSLESCLFSHRLDMSSLALSQLVSLKHLHVCGTDLSAADIMHLCTPLPAGLETLRIERQDMSFGSDAGYLALILHGLDNLRILELVDTRIPAKHCLSLLRVVFRMRALSKLDLSGNQIGAVLLQKLAEHEPAWEELDISNNQIDWTVHAAHLRNVLRARNLKRLSIGRCPAAAAAKEVQEAAGTLQLIRHDPAPS